MLALTNVCAGSAGFQALFDATLEVRAGEAVAVIGPNRAGKTTRLRVVSELLEPSCRRVPLVVQFIFELVRRICAQGYTVLIVEQNIRQVLRVVNRAYLLDAGRIVRSGTADELRAAPEIQKAYLGV